MQRGGIGEETNVMYLKGWDSECIKIKRKKPGTRNPSTRDNISAAKAFQPGSANPERRRSMGLYTQYLRIFADSYPSGVDVSGKIN